MYGIHDSYLVNYGIGLVFMSFLLIRAFVVKDENLMNFFGIEKDAQKFRKVRIVYTVTQAICLFLLVLCFFYLKNFYVSLAAIAFGCVIPLGVSLLCDMYLTRRHKHRKKISL